MKSANRWIVSHLAGVVAAIAGAASVSVLIWGTALAREQNLGSPAFANPPEVRYRDKEKTLRMVMELSSGRYTIPNAGTENVRQFRGWDPAKPPPAPGPDISPGPTLRARLGDQVQIAFLNKIDDAQFPYTFDTDSPPGYSSFGCDESGAAGPATTQAYPKNDKFPNCFHGSSTANIHFHGTHTSPDGLGDNVLVQVMPQVKQPDWTNTFNGIFKGKIPQRWQDMPAAYRTRQMALVKQHDTAAAAAAAKNKLPAPTSLYAANQQRIADGEWPQYLVGAFPNYFEIPDYASGKYKAGQAPGTHWYHAHKHGSTSLHILNGLAGAFVIESSQEGGYDHFIRSFYNWGTSYGDHEKILVLQQYDVTQNLERAKGAGPSPVLVNGKLTPTITMRPGEVQLWRFVLATEGNNRGVISSSLFAGAQKAGFGLKQTAQDGVQLSPTNYASQPFLNNVVPQGLTLAGGNRADLLVQAPTTTGVFPMASGTNTIFFVSVAGTAVTQNPPFPPTWAELPPFLNDLLPPGPKDHPNPGSPVKFQWEAGRKAPGFDKNGFPPHFMINNKQFGETGDVVDQCMPLNGLQDWILENYSTPLHPFHIHINPFQVLAISIPTLPAGATQATYKSYTPTNNFVWQDVIALPPAVFGTDGTIYPSRITIRQTYLDFTGTYVLHCHILAHEDRGMMQLVRVVPADKYPKGCQINVPAHH